MTQINLLPWREERRVRLKNEFITTVFLVAALAAVLVFFAYYSVGAQIAEQQARNQYIQKEVALLDKDIKEINQLKKRRKELIARMQVIQNLQGNRPVVVHLFDELVRLLPEGVHLKKLTRKGRSFSLEGVADSNNRVSNLMRNFDKSLWFVAPNLKKISAVGKTGKNNFLLTVNSKNLTPPKKKKKKKKKAGRRR